MKINMNLAGLLMSIVLAGGIMGCSAKTTPTVSELPEVVL